MVDSWRLRSGLIKTTAVVMGLGSLSGCASIQPRQIEENFFSDLHEAQNTLELDEGAFENKKPCSALIIDVNFGPVRSDVFTKNIVRIEPFIKFSDEKIQKAWIEFQEKGKGHYSKIMPHGTLVASFAVSDPEVDAGTTVYGYDTIEMADFLTQIKQTPDVDPWPSICYSNKVSPVAHQAARSIGFVVARKLGVDGVNISLSDTRADINMPLLQDLLQEGVLITQSSGNEKWHHQVKGQIGDSANIINSERYPGKLLIIGRLTPATEEELVNEGNLAGKQQDYYFSFFGDEKFGGSSFTAPAALGMYLKDKLSGRTTTPAHFYKNLQASAVDLGARGPDKIFGQGGIYVRNMFSSLNESVATCCAPPPQTVVKSDPSVPPETFLPASTAIINDLPLVNEPEPYLLFSDGQKYTVLFANELLQSPAR